MASTWQELYGDPFGPLDQFRSVMDGTQRTLSARADKTSGTGGADLFRLLGGNDVLSAGGGNDWIDGGKGNDTVRAGNGHDFAQGGDGADWLHGDAGNDRLDGGAGIDHLAGGTGNDEIQGWTGNDRIDGGDGADNMDGGPGSDTVRGGAGDDMLWAGSSGVDHLYGGTGANTFFAWGNVRGVVEERPWGGTVVPAGSVHYHLEGRADTVWDNGISTDTDVLHYTGRGSATVHWFGGAAVTEYDPAFALPPFHSYGATDKVVLENVHVGGNRIDSFAEFTTMIADGRIGYAHTAKQPDGYYPLDGQSWRGNWDTGSIVLDFGAAPDGTPRILSFHTTSLSGTDGVASFSAADWLIA